MLEYFIRLLKWIKNNIVIAYIMYLILPIISFYLNIYKNYSWELIATLIILVFILRFFVGILVAINLLSKNNKRKSKNKKKGKRKILIAFACLNLITGVIITVTPLFVSNNFTQTYIQKKLENESELKSAKIYNLNYWNGHLLGSKGYEYEFYINNKRYTGKHTERNGKIGKIIQIEYYRENPWINKKHE